MESNDELVTDGKILPRKIQGNQRENGDERKDEEKADQIKLVPFDNEERLVDHLCQSFDHHQI